MTNKQAKGRPLRQAKSESHTLPAGMQTNKDRQAGKSPSFSCPLGSHHHGHQFLHVKHAFQ